MGLFSRKNSRSTLSDTSSIETNGNRKSSVSMLSSNSVRGSINSGRSPKSPTGMAALPESASLSAPDPDLDPAGYLRSIHAIRARCRPILEKAKVNQLQHFDVDPLKFVETAQYVVSIIKRDYGSDYASIPAHGRWQHFDVGGRPRIDQLLGSWPLSVDALERTRRLIDLFLISVLLDAGAGATWQYKSKQSGKIYRRSEGLAVASLEMFTAGLFSSDPSEKCQVDSAGLRRLRLDHISKGLQITSTNTLPGLEGRAGLVMRLADALEHRDYFGETSRPGNMIDYLMSHPTTQMTSVPVIAIPTLWHILMDGLAPIWPSSRVEIGGVSIGDAWPCSSMPESPPALAWETIVPFHKLTQWLAYSLMGPMSRLMKCRFSGTDLMTGLPEYRNGGLLIDTGLLTLKEDDMARGLAAYHANALRIGQPKVEVVPLFSPDDDVIVEWRALTVSFMDELLYEVNRLLGLGLRDGLSLPQMLEAGTWKGGRELAEVSRPNTKEPPIMTLSDGTIF